MNTGVVVLAAGDSKRMGMVKQIMPVFETPLLKYVVDQVLETRFHPVAVVVGAHKEKVVPVLKDMPIAIVDNPEWIKGMGSSMRMGLIGSYMLTKGIEALIFLASDMPEVNRKNLEELVSIAESNPEKELFFSYDGGFPLLVKSAFFEKLLDLNDDDPFEVLNKVAEEKKYQYNQKIKATDLNTPEDYLRFLETVN